MRKRSVQFLTLGCKVNQYETQAIREQFLRSGFVEVEPGEFSEIFFVNTCTVTKHADTESLNLIRRSYRINPQANVVVSGCLVEKDRDIIANIKGEKLIVENSRKNFVADLVKNNSLPPIENNTQDFTPLTITDFRNHSKAFIKVQDGCNNFCSYCKVPYVRGRSRSRPLKEIKNELGALLRKGFKEIILTGICLGEWGKDFGKGCDLKILLDELESIEGDFRIRLSSIEPNNISINLIEKIRDSEKICTHLHIPLQSGDDDILKRMNRNYGSSYFKSLTASIKKEIPEIALTTDCLVGFPGESDENFENTLSLIEKIQPLRVHIFPYSRRKFTAAYNYNNLVDPKTIKLRIGRLKEVAQKASCLYRSNFINKTLKVLLESEVQLENRPYFVGYSDNYIHLTIKSGKKCNIGEIVDVKVLKIDKDLTFGEAN